MAIGLPNLNKRHRDRAAHRLPAAINLSFQYAATVSSQSGHQSYTPNDITPRSYGCRHGRWHWVMEPRNRWRAVCNSHGIRLDSGRIN